VEVADILAENASDLPGAVALRLRTDTTWISLDTLPKRPPIVRNHGKVPELSEDACRDLSLSVIQP
jgi:hypothetical protein